MGSDLGKTQTSHCSMGSEYKLFQTTAKRWLATRGEPAQQKNPASPRRTPVITSRCGHLPRANYHHLLVRFGKPVGSKSILVNSRESHKSGGLASNALCGPRRRAASATGEPVLSAAEGMRWAAEPAKASAAQQLNNSTVCKQSFCNKYGAAASMRLAAAICACQKAGQGSACVGFIPGGFNCSY